jgi:hypothetical protein
MNLSVYEWIYVSYRVFTESYSGKACACTSSHKHGDFSQMHFRELDIHTAPQVMHPDLFAEERFSCWAM